MNTKTFSYALMALAFLPLTANADGISFKTSRGNIYSAGGSVDVTENAPNDIVAAGGNVIITGNAGNEVLAAGGTVLLLGKAGGDVRIAGGNISVNNEIGGEAVLAGGRIRLLPGTTIESDLIAASGDITVEGTVGGDARITGGTVTISGTVKKNAEIKARRLVIGQNAVINGTLRYEAPQEARIEHGAAIKGQTIFVPEKFAAPREKLRRFLWAWWAVKFFATAAAALAIYFALRKKTEEFTLLALKRFGAELLTGFIVLIVIPAAIVILFITVVGLLLGLIGAVFYIAFLAVSTVLGAVVFSGLTGKYVIKKEPFLTWRVILLGVFIYQIIGLIPGVGWIIKFVFFLSALGAMSHLVYMRLSETS